MLRERERGEKRGPSCKLFRERSPLQIRYCEQVTRQFRSQRGNSPIRPSALESGPKTKVGLAVCGTVENWKALAETFTMPAPRAKRNCQSANKRSSLRSWQPQSLTRN